MENERQLLIQCRTLIERSLSWGDSDAWSNDDFAQLSEKIFGKTKVQLSISTLKRIWGKVRYENFPTTGTLNALARFIDFDNWRDFRQKNQVDDAPSSLPDKTAATTHEEVYIQPGIKKQSEKKISVSEFLVLGILAILVLTYLVSRKTIKPADLSTVKFAAVKVSDTLPNSVIFNYDASAFKSDSVFIQQSWDPARRVSVPGNGKQFTSIYYQPGYFIAKLIVDHRIEKECVVSIQTKGWKGIIEEKPVPVYLSANEIKGKGFIGITENTLRQKIGSPIFNETWVKFSNVQEFKGIDAANFMFETTLRNSSAIEASVCRKVRALILGTSTAIIIPLADKGCISVLDLWTGEQFISGKDHDMTAFGCDFSRFQYLKLIVEKQHFKIYLNNNLIMDTVQKHTIGKIEGIRFEFEGAGEIKDVKLSTPGAAVYAEHF